MPNPTPPQTGFSGPGDAEVAQYRAVCKFAVVGLALGLLSPIALLGRAFWAVPAAGAIAGIVGLWRTSRQSSEVVGRGLAVAALALSVLFASAACTDWLVHRRQVTAEAQQFAAMWFDYLRQGRPQRAHQLTLSPSVRLPFDGRLWEYYRTADHKAEDLKAYVNKPVVRALLALADKALVRYCQTTATAQSAEGGKEWVELVYAVTYSDDGATKTFFVAIGLERTALEGGRAQWQIRGVEGGIRPPGW
jgi:hypothetical protein